MKREKGLYYRRDEKFSSGHRCQPKELQVMVYQGEEELLESNEKDQEVHGLDQELVELSMNLVGGLTSPKTIKLKGKVCRKEVMVFIDPGATHNFISQALVKQLEIQLDETEGYEVLLRTGVPVKGEGVCRGVQLLLQGVKIVEDFMPLDLGGSDFILGM